MKNPLLIKPKRSIGDAMSSTNSVGVTWKLIMLRP